MNWLVDNAGTLYILLGIIAAALTAVWWSNRQMAYLYGAIGNVALLLLIWMMVHFVPSDRRRVEDNVHAMAAAVEKGNVDELGRLVSKDFRFELLTREAVLDQLREALRHTKIREVRIRKFEVQELSRDQKTANVSFNVTAWAGARDQPMPARVEATFILEAEQWLLYRIEFYKPFVDANEKFNPFPR